MEIIFTSYTKYAKYNMIHFLVIFKYFHRMLYLYLYIYIYIDL